MMFSHRFGQLRQRFLAESFIANTPVARRWSRLRTDRLPGEMGIAQDTRIRAERIVPQEIRISSNS